MLTLSLSRFELRADLLARCEKALTALRERKEATFFRLVDDDAMWAEAANVGRVLREKFKHLVVCGIGGSSLGGQVVSAIPERSRITYLENVDGDEFDRLLARLDAATTGFLFISKSGGTIETLAAADYIRDEWERRGLDLKNFAHVMTESKGNALGRWATERGIPMTLLAPDVGGRYSVLSPVGMVPAAMEGLDLAGFRAGARRALANPELSARLMAETLLSFERGEWITVFWFYDRMGRLAGGWLQQLWGESLGKATGRDGRPAPRVSTPMVALGAVDQHSFLQQIIEGARDKFVVFLRTDRAEGGRKILRQSGFSATKSLEGRSLGRLLAAEAMATEEALHQRGASTLTLKTEVLDEEGLGEFFMTFQCVVAGLGEALGINPFDQPGVELGKGLANQFLQKP